MKLTQETISQINVFEKQTGARVKDCLGEEDGVITFLVEEGNVKKALGYENKNIFRLGKLFKKKIRVLGFSSDPVKFINNILYPVRADKVEVRDGEAWITAKDNITKGKIFGRSKQNLEKIKGLLKKYHNIAEVKIL
jgi:N utilization substance protein A